MKLYQFKLLEPKEQDAILNMHGVHLGERTDGHYTFELYQIDDFYIEEMWHTAFNERRSFTAFVSVEHLQPYFEVIDIANSISK